jgi:hypothetical protein
VAPGAKAPPAPILLGPTTRERACRVLEQQLGAVWAAVLESHGFDPAVGFRLTIKELGLAPGPPETGENGRPADAVG